MSRRLQVKLLTGEYWWGGAIDDGVRMPFGAAEYHKDLAGDLIGNQAVPLLISNKGRYIWSESPFVLHFTDGELLVTSKYGEVELGDGQEDLRTVFRHVSRRFFPWIVEC